MPKYQFVCNAKVSLEVDAGSLEEAQFVWSEFCCNLEAEDTVFHSDLPFHVKLFPKPPDVPGPS